MRSTFINFIGNSLLNLGIRETFIGAVIIAIITNIAEKSAAIHFALENKLDVAIEIGLSSATQHRQRMIMGYNPLHQRVFISFL